MNVERMWKRYLSARIARQEPPLPLERLLAGMDGPARPRGRLDFVPNLVFHGVLAAFALLLLLVPNRMFNGLDERVQEISENYRLRQTITRGIDVVIDRVQETNPIRRKP